MNNANVHKIRCNWTILNIKWISVSIQPNVRIKHVLRLSRDVLRDMKLLILVVICSVLVDLHQSVIQRPRPNQKPKQSPRPDWAQTKELDTEIIKDDGEECVKKCNARIKEYNKKYNGWVDIIEKVVKDKVKNRFLK